MTIALHSMQYWSAIKTWTAHRINLNTYSEIDQNVNHVYWSGKVEWDFSSFCLSQDQIILDLAWALSPNTAVLIKERREIWHTQERPCEDRGREGTYATTDKEPPETGTGKEEPPTHTPQMERVGPGDTLFQTLGLHNCERINICCLSPPSWWWSVAAVLGNYFTWASPVIASGEECGLWSLAAWA